MDNEAEVLFLEKEEATLAIEAIEHYLAYIGKEEIYSISQKVDMISDLTMAKTKIKFQAQKQADANI